MSYVPFVPPSPPSPRVYELGRRLKEVIDSFRREDPDVTSAEIRQAFGMAMGGVSTKARSTLIALALGLLALGFLGFLLFRASGGRG